MLPLAVGEIPRISHKVWNSLWRTSTNDGRALKLAPGESSGWVLGWEEDVCVVDVFPMTSIVTLFNVISRSLNSPEKVS